MNASERNRQIIRQWQLLRALEHRGRTLHELAGDLDVTTRTIRRDIEALEAAGFPLYDDVDDAGARRWRLLPSTAAPARRAA